MAIDSSPCPHCQRPNAAGSRFCTACGQNLEPVQFCAKCNARVPLSSAFCSQCGQDLGASPEGARAQGVVSEGQWLRPDGEFIRRVDPEDCRSFLGTRTLVVPAGTVGLVVVDGVLERVLPPGERTTITLFERIARFFHDLTSGGPRDDRTALFLVDQRPVPVPFAVTTRGSRDGRSLATQVLCTFHLPRGDKARMAAFLANVVGDRAGFAAQDLHDLLRPEVGRIATLRLEKLQEAERFSYPEAERAVRDALEDSLGPRYGLAVSVTLAPVAATVSFNVCLGTGRAPRVRACVGCARELPSALIFCDGCGARQPTAMAPERACSACGSSIADAHGFCTGCGAAFTAPSAAAQPLFSRDGEELEVDLVVRVVGANPDFRVEALHAALAGAAAAYVRTVDFGVLASASGFAGLAGAMQADLELALAAFGLNLGALDVLDLRTKHGAWLLGARADLGRAREALGLGRDWLQQRASELDLESLALAQSLAQQAVQREHRLAEVREGLVEGRREAGLRLEDSLARDTATLADRAAREGLADRAAAFDAAGARRDASTTLETRRAQREVESADRAYGRDVEVEAQEHTQARRWSAAEHDAGLERARLSLEAERTRQAIELDLERAQAAAAAARAASGAAFDDHERRRRLDVETADREVARQTEKLRAMAELEREMAADDAKREQERIAALKGLDAKAALALQAVELAKSEGGAAFADALARLAEAESTASRHADAERHASELRDLMATQARATEGTLGAQLERLTRLAEAGTRGASESVVTGSLAAMAQVAASRAAPAATVAAVSVPSVETTPCTACGAALRPGARFCGACGGAQPA